MLTGYMNKLHRRCGAQSGISDQLTHSLIQSPLARLVIHRYLNYKDNGYDGTRTWRSWSFYYPIISNQWGGDNLGCSEYVPSIPHSSFFILYYQFVFTLISHLLNTEGVGVEIETAHAALMNERREDES